MYMRMLRLLTRYDEADQNRPHATSMIKILMFVFVPGCDHR